MYDENEETFTYQPTSFVTSQIYVNPESPRHFKNKRWRQNSTNVISNNDNNNNNDNYKNVDKAPKLKGRPQSLIDFQFIGRKSATKKAAECRRSKTVIERCRGAIRRAMSMDTLLDDDDSAETTPSSRKKTTISRLKKTRDVRKVNGGSNLISLPLLRSKSEVNLYHTQDFNDDDDDDNAIIQKRQSISGVSISGPGNYVVRDVVKEANFQTNLNRDSSISFDSLITHSTRSRGSSTSSPNSSGFYECTGSEHGSLSRADSLSSDGSVSAFKKHRNQISTGDKMNSKYPSVEERECTRKPLKVIRSTSKSKSRGRPKQQDNPRNVSPPAVCFSAPSSCPSTTPSESPTQLHNEVFTSYHEEDYEEDQRDSGLDIPASNKITQRRPTPKHPKNKRGGWWSTSEVFTTVEIPCDGPPDSTDMTKTNSLPYLPRTECRGTLEETVEKISVSLRQSNLGYSNIGHSNSFHCSRYPPSTEGRERKRVEKSRSVDNSSSYTLPSPVRQTDTARRRLSYYGHIRIESVL